MATAATSPVEPVNLAPELVCLGAGHNTLYSIVPLADENQETNTKTVDPRGFQNAVPALAQPMGLLFSLVCIELAAAASVCCRLTPGIAVDTIRHSVPGNLHTAGHTSILSRWFTMPNVAEMPGKSHRAFGFREP